MTDDATKIRRIEDHYQSFWSGDLDDFDHQLSPDFVDVVAPTPPGIDGVKEWARSARQGFSDMTYTLKHAIVCGDYVATVGHWRGTNDGPIFGREPTGRPAEWDGLVVWKLDEQNRISERHAFFDPEDIIRALDGAPTTDTA